jgi:hypothetical protein
LGERLGLSCMPKCGLTGGISAQLKIYWQQPPAR